MTVFLVLDSFKMIRNKGFVLGVVLWFLVVHGRAQEQHEEWTASVIRHKEYLANLLAEQMKEADRDLQIRGGGTSVPTESPAPSPSPSKAPTARPTKSFKPTEPPTTSPTESPAPSPSPSKAPTARPSKAPTSRPSYQPSALPSSDPSTQPSSRPSVQPSSKPSFAPSSRPSSQPSSEPSANPSLSPSSQPSSQPSSEPSANPSLQPSSRPSSRPSWQPSSRPSSLPSFEPTWLPSAKPSSLPSSIPTSRPSWNPTLPPSSKPTSDPSMSPSFKPTSDPSMSPSLRPSVQPSLRPSTLPSPVPTAIPSSNPSDDPTSNPTHPTIVPTTSGAPSQTPSVNPSGNPSSTPSELPSTSPTLVRAMAAEFRTQFNELQDILLTKEIRNFEFATAEWVESIKFPHGVLSSVQTTVTKQNLLSRTSGRRNLQNEALQITFKVSGTYTGVDESFDLFNALIPFVSVHDPNWLGMLSHQDSAFSPLAPASLTSNFRQGIGAEEGGKAGLTPAAYAGVIFVAIVAVTLAIGASVYAIRSYSASQNVSHVAQANPTKRLVPRIYTMPTPSDDNLLDASVQQQSSIFHQQGNITVPAPSVASSGMGSLLQNTRNGCVQQLDSAQNCGTAFPKSAMDFLTCASGNEDELSPTNEREEGKREQFDGSKYSKSGPSHNGARKATKQDYLAPSHFENTGEFHHIDDGGQFINSTTPSPFMGARPHQAHRMVEESPMTSQPSPFRVVPPRNQPHRPLDPPTSLALDYGFEQNDGNLSEYSENYRNRPSVSSYADPSPTANPYAQFSDNNRGRPTASYADPSPTANPYSQYREIKDRSRPSVSYGDPSRAARPNSHHETNRSRPRMSYVDPSPTAHPYAQYGENNKPRPHPSVSYADPSPTAHPYGRDEDRRHSGQHNDRLALHGRHPRPSEAQDKVARALGNRPGKPTKSSSLLGTDLTSHAKAFFNSVMGSSEPPPPPPPPPPSQMEPKHQQRIAETLSSEFLGNAGLYDVFAPPGPIGIVVDTTKEGPSVHSLKATSPMLGLISPGDLIVGLDDQDTRGMTAATLTRLMAQKSNQNERKITLLTME